MEKFNRIFWRSIGDRVVDLICHSHTAHGNSPIGQGFRHGDDIWFDVEFLRGKSGAHAAKAGDDLVKHQQKSMFRTNFADFFQIANWRDQRTS